MGVYDTPSSQFDTVDPKAFNQLLAAPVEPYRPPVEPNTTESRSPIGEIWSQLKAGAFSDLPKMAGKAMQYVSSPGNSTYETGKRLVEDANAIATLPEMQPSAASDSFITGALAKGARMIPTSVAPAMGAGLLLSGVGAPAGVALIGGSALQAAPSGMAQAQETYEKGLAKHGLTPEQAAAMPDDPRVREATNAGRITGGIEFGGELAGDSLAGRFLGIGGSMAKSAIGRVLNKGEQTAAQAVLKSFTNPGAVGRFAGNALETAAGETATEMGQNYGEAAVEKHYAYDNQDPWDSAKEAIAPTLGMTALLMPFGIPAHASHAMKMSSITTALQNPDIAPEARTQAAEIIYNELAKSSPDAAANFAAHSFDAIHGGQETGSAPYGLTLDDSVLNPLTPRVLQEEQQQTEPSGPLGKAAAKAMPEIQPAPPLDSTQQDNELAPSTPFDAFHEQPVDHLAPPAFQEEGPTESTHGSAVAPSYSIQQDNALAQPAADAILNQSTQGLRQHESLDASLHGGQEGTAESAANIGDSALEHPLFHDPAELIRTVEATPIIGERFNNPATRKTFLANYHNPAFWAAMAERQPELADKFNAVATILDSKPEPLPLGARVAANLAADAIRLNADPSFAQQASDLNSPSAQDLAAKWYQEHGEQSPFFRLWSRNAPVVSIDNALPASSVSTGTPITVKAWHASPDTVNRYHKEYSGAHSGFESKGWIWTAPKEEAQAHSDSVSGMHGDNYTTDQFYQRMKNPKVLRMINKRVTRAAMEKAQAQGHDGVLLTAGGKVVNAVVFEANNLKAVDNRGTFNPSEYSRYSIQEEAPNVRPATDNTSSQTIPAISLQAVQAAFPGQTVTQDTEGHTVTLKNGATVKITTAGDISFNVAAAEADYGRKLKQGELPVASFQALDRQAVITLTEQGAGEIHHEAFHAAMAMALNNKQRTWILNKYGTEETAAAAYQRLRDNGSFEAHKGGVPMYFRILYAFFKKLKAIFNPAATVMQDIASGKAWEPTTTASTSPATVKYSLTTINDKAAAIKRHLSETAANKSTFVKHDIAPAIKATGEGIATAWDGIKAAVNPMDRSAAAEEAGRILIEGMGHMEHGKEKFINELNKAAMQSGYATTRLAKALDLMQTSTTLADKLFASMPDQERINFMQNMDTGQPQATRELQQVANAIKTMFEDKAKAVQALGTGALESVRENYFPHAWDRSNDARKEINSRLSKRPLEGSKAFSKARVFDDINAGIEAGFKLVDTNPINLVFLKTAEMDKYINAHVALQAMEQSELVQLIPAGEKMPDGYGDISGKYGLVTKRAHQDSTTGQPGEMKSYRYIAREDVAQVFNNYLSQNLYNNKYVGKPFSAYMQAANTLNQFQLGVFSAFHAGFTSLEAVISHAALGIKALTRGDFQEAGKYFTHAPAAWYLNPKLGDKVIKAWMGDEAAAKEMPQIVQWLEMAGARRIMDSRFQTDQTQKMFHAWSEGNKIGAGGRTIPAIVEQSARPILEWLVPRQKFGVFAEMANEWNHNHPEASHEATRKAMQQIWNRVDSRLGQVVYDRLFIHNVAKNLTQAIIRAPGWTGGTILEVGGGFKDLVSFAKDLTIKGKQAELSDRAAYTLSLLVTTAVANAILTAAFTGEPPEDWKDLLAFRTGSKDEKGNPERFMLPTYAKDLYAYTQKPGTTLLHKTHPMISMIGDLIQNKDYYGTEIRHQGDNPIFQLMQAGKFTAKAFIPFWMKGAAKELERGGSIGAMAAPLIGIMPAPSDLNKTEAERLASKLVADRMPQGSKTQDQFERSQLIQHLTGLARRDKAQALQEVREALQNKEITMIQARHIFQNARLAPIQIAFKRLSYEEAQRVYEVATDAEKKKLRYLMAKKRSRYLQ